MRTIIRTGIGYDVHRLEFGRSLVLGGVKIVHPQGMGLVGHSDADVLCHAIADAILGASGLQDIGHYFPNSDASIEGISSLKILNHTVSIITNLGAKIINIDSMLIAEEPKITPYISIMKENIATSIGVRVSRIGVKATTNEMCGFLGRGEGIAAFATASVETYEQE